MRPMVSVAVAVVQVKPRVAAGMALEPQRICYCTLFGCFRPPCASRNVWVEGAVVPGDAPLKGFLFPFPLKAVLRCADIGCGSARKPFLNHCTNLHLGC